jgi:hypothetical protein
MQIEEVGGSSEQNQEANVSDESIDESIDDFEVSPECPNCKAPLGPIKLASLQTTQTIACSGCGEDVEVKDSSGVGSSLRGLQAAFEDLRRL